MNFNLCLSHSARKRTSLTFMFHGIWEEKKKSKHSRSALYSDFPTKTSNSCSQKCLLTVISCYSKICRARNTLDFNHLQTPSNPVHKIRNLSKNLFEAKVKRVEIDEWKMLVVSVSKILLVSYEPLFHYQTMPYPYELSHPLLNRNSTRARS